MYFWAFPGLLSLCFMQAAFGGALLNYVCAHLQLLGGKWSLFEYF